VAETSTDQFESSFVLWGMGMASGCCSDLRQLGAILDRRRNCRVQFAQRPLVVAGLGLSGAHHPFAAPHVWKRRLFGRLCPHSHPASGGSSPVGPVASRLIIARIPA
jgi:hypothetical protein